MSDVSPLSRISGISFGSLYYLLSCSTAYSHCSVCLVPFWPFWLVTFFLQKILQYFSLGDRLFGMVLV